uniref:Uncharacterized protein n=1 Tax=Nicotiana tabacum TaxID=4097 RepID=A0A1S4D0F6_TOBAC
MKAQALADHLAENPVDDEYQPLSTYFPDEEVNSVEVTLEDANDWKMFFDGAMNAKGIGIGAILISPTSQHYLATARLWFFCTNNTAEYAAYIMEVEIPSLRIIIEAEIEDSEWVKTRLEQLTLIDEKRMAAFCHGQLYQQRMARAYYKKVWPRNFEVGQLFLRRILPHHKESKGKFASNWKGPYIITKLLPKGALYLGDIEGNDPKTAINADVVK